ncbi:hypothetical protein GCK72_013109 [Caenorhabditis remanei]|uniref:BAR domain-containing protein n=1 Tax=Caenorhabditis remanei TaxID=31234 RepID=A0A6A5GQ57_CAERE|nr:hypothetical protein GCK72_013109 [Caenorhabditis remanei]KAF1756655.1 hypothetical protein GCK72_013109 [Caenorhabditis remanei]
MSREKRAAAHCMRNRKCVISIIKKMSSLECSMDTLDEKLVKALDECYHVAVEHNTHVNHVLYENSKEEVESVGEESEEEIAEWSFMDSLLFAFTVITTIENEDHKKKSPNESDDKKHVDAAVDQVGHTGWYNRFKVHLGQKLGTAECTKLEPRFDRNIEKLLSYHNIIFNMVDAIELQVQIDPSNISKKRVLAPPEKNLWSQLGGWFHFLSLRHYTGAEAHLLDRFSYTCSKIAQKDMQIQKRTRTHLIKRMLLYIGDESVELNNSLKSAQITSEAKSRGAAYHQMILGFNSKASEIQGWIDEVTIIVTLHQNELIKFSRELSMYHDSVYNSIMEVLLRLGYHVHRKK